MRDTDRSSLEMDQATELATLGGGCFWCLEPVFDELVGVQQVEVGYAGGEMASPSYEQVCGGRTGHAEVVQIRFDPRQISYRDLLEIFFSIHDPTTPDRQGADVGPQYRSLVLSHSAEQRKIAEDLAAELRADGIPVVTQLEPFQAFYRAEEYHQAYYRKNPSAGYCRVVVAPKLAKFRAKYTSRLRAAAQKA
ncbi:MAG TPA: peptide-methionine (S)-S-oxide reductase MsrA [Gemmatimonadales bacterium]